MTAKNFFLMLEKYFIRDKHPRTHIFFPQLPETTCETIPRRMRNAQRHASGTGIVIRIFWQAPD
jgi:hypothetical protein